MKELKIINTTPHDIVFMNDNQEIVRTFPKSDSPLRLKEKQEYLYEVDGIKVFQKKFLEDCIAPKSEKTIFIVSLIVAQSFPDRDDFLVVNDTVRDSGGRIIGVAVCYMYLLAALLGYA